MYGKYNTELDLAASGAISGGKLQNSGTLNLTFSTDLEYVDFERKIRAIDWDGNSLSPALSSSAAGGSWSNDSEKVQAGYGSPHVVSVNLATFRSAYASHGSNLGGLRIEVFISNSSGEYIGGDEYDFYFNPTTHVNPPTSPKVTETVSRDAVELSWGAGSAGTNNSVTGYDVQYQDSADGSTWPSGWTTASGSPVTGTSMNVSPPTTVGYYRRFRVRTRGSAGSDYYSDWVISENVLRRKWNDFGAWTDPTLSVGGDLRAVHMTEMQERIKTIRSFYGLSAAAFTTITGGVTLAADWVDHISEIRTAIDGITTDHAAWITATAGEPAVDVMNQMRSIIDNL